jgi:hypothetical protein
MTASAKEKAEELVDKFYNEVLIDNYESKRCALIAVDEILNILYSIPFGNALDNELEYLEEVKQEIELL